MAFISHAFNWKRCKMCNKSRKIYLEATRRCSTCSGWATLDLNWWHRNKGFLLLHSQLLMTPQNCLHIQVLKRMLFCRRQSAQNKPNPILGKIQRTHAEKLLFKKAPTFYIYSIYRILILYLMQRFFSVVLLPETLCNDKAVWRLESKNCMKTTFMFLRLTIVMRQ